MKVRSFLAFDISDEMKSEIRSIITLLSSKVKGVRWVKPELMHCTLRFFGDVEEEVLLGALSKVIEREVRHQSPMHLVGRGVGVFPNWRYPKVLWAGLTGDTEAVASLHAKLEQAFKEFGFPKDPRALRLHLTLGRAKTGFKGRAPLMQTVEKMTNREFGELMVRSLTLYKSVLTPEGPIYTQLRSFPLGGQEAK
jgi:2'-5' RNA ligase